MNKEHAVSFKSLETILPVFEDNILEKIKKSSPISVEPEGDDIPRIYITGEIPTKKENVKAKLEYVSKTHKFESYIKIKLQGSYTMTLPKKNFTIQLFEDEYRSIPYYEDFKGWGKTNHYVLKADYNDITHARNVVAANLWGKIVESRSDYDTLPEELINSPNNGAIDGFPVTVYLNGKFQGLYTLTVSKTAFLFGMDKNNENHVALNAERNDEGKQELMYNPCNFREMWSGVDGDYWSYVTGKDALDSWTLLYNAINSGNISEIEKYLDIQSVRDYFIFQNVILGVDGYAKNMMLLTYDKTKWYLSPYDLNETFGIFTTEMIPSDGTGDNYNLNRYNVLWEMLLEVYSVEDTANRYRELRSTVLSKKSIIEEFEKFIGIYGEDEYIKDTTVYPEIPNVSENNIYYLRQFISDRLDYLDTNWLGGVLNG